MTIFDEQQLKRLQERIEALEGRADSFDSTAYKVDALEQTIYTGQAEHHKLRNTVEALKNTVVRQVGTSDGHHKRLSYFGKRIAALYAQVDAIGVPDGDSTLLDAIVELQHNQAATERLVKALVTSQHSNADALTILFAAIGEEAKGDEKVKTFHRPEEGQDLHDGAAHSLSEPCDKTCNHPKGEGQDLSEDHRKVPTSAGPKKTPGSGGQDGEQTGPSGPEHSATRTRGPDETL